MMRMLAAGGIPLYYEADKPMEFWRDGTHYINYNLILRESDKLRLAAGDSEEWIKDCQGKAVKILTPAKTKIPIGPDYRFIWMDRKAKHCANSNRKFMKRTGKTDPAMEHLINSTGNDELMEYIADQKSRGLSMLRAYPNSKLIIVRFEDMIKKPRVIAGKVARFLKMALSVSEMAKIVVKRPAHCLTGMLEEEIYV